MTLARGHLQDWVPEDAHDVPLPRQLIDKTLFATEEIAVEDAGNEDGSSVPPKGAIRSEAALTRHIDYVEGELVKAKDMVNEAYQAVNDLCERHQRSKSARQHAHQKFRKLRQDAIQLKSENRAHREKFQQSQIKLRVLTEKRDEYYERVQVLFHENRNLKNKLQASGRAT